MIILRGKCFVFSLGEFLEKCSVCSGIYFDFILVEIFSNVVWLIEMGLMELF